MTSYENKVDKIIDWCNNGAPEHFDDTTIRGISYWINGNGSSDLSDLQKDSIDNIYYKWHIGKWWKKNYDTLNLSDTDTEDNEIELNYNSMEYMKKLKINDLEKYVRIKLGQKFDNNAPNSYHGQNHKRFQYHTNNEDDIENNKEICEIFKYDLYPNQLVMYAWEGIAYYYIVSRNNYEKYNYWNEPGENGLNLPFLYNHEYPDKGFGHGTVLDLVELMSLYS